MILVDGHLDIAFNRVCFGRDPRESALRVREREDAFPPVKWRGRCMVGLPELRAGRVAVVFGTLFIPRAKEWGPAGLDPSLMYSSAQEAEAQARRQLDVYEEVADGEHFRIVGDAAGLVKVLEAWEAGGAGPAGIGPGENAPEESAPGESAPVGIVPLMEGADPIVAPEDVPRWFDRGVRIVGLAWRGTRYSGGTGEPGPLTPPGRRLVRELDAAGMILDLSHASDESAFEALDLFDGPVIASHSNPRAVCPGDRQIPDDLVRAIGERGGVIGSVPFNRMLVPDWSSDGGAPVPLARVADMVHHVAQVSGTHETCGIGSDFDGGFGAEAAPQGMDTVADLMRIADVLSDKGFGDGQIADILGGNWIRFLERALPAVTA